MHPQVKQLPVWSVCQGKAHGPLCVGGTGRGRVVKGVEKRGARQEVGKQQPLQLGYQGEWMREGTGSWGSEDQDPIISKPHCTTRRGWKDLSEVGGKQWKGQRWGRSRELGCWVSSEQHLKGALQPKG